METALLNKKNTLGNIDTYNVTRGFCRVLENLRYNKLHHFPGKFILMKFQVLHRIQLTPSWQAESSVYQMTENCLVSYTESGRTSKEYIGSPIIYHVHKSFGETR